MQRWERNTSVSASSNDSQRSLAECRRCPNDSGLEHVWVVTSWRHAPRLCLALKVTPANRRGPTSASWISSTQSLKIFRLINSLGAAPWLIQSRSGYRSKLFFHRDRTKLGLCSVGIWVHLWGHQSWAIATWSYDKIFQYEHDPLVLHLLSDKKPAQPAGNATIGWPTVSLRMRRHRIRLTPVQPAQHS